MSAGLRLLSTVWQDWKADPLPIADVAPPVHQVPLPSRLSTGDLAWASVAAMSLAAGRRAAGVDDLDPARIAAAFRSDRYLRIDGEAPPVWSPFSGFWRTSEGWVRTHGNYPHHASALRRALAIAEGARAEDVQEAFAAISVADAVSRISAAGGLAVPVLGEQPDRDTELRRRPVVEVRRLDTSGSSVRQDRARTEAPDALPLQGVRVLDLTRVIAGPVCTRTLALLGADVLRIDPPEIAEPEWQHLDTGHGKRSAILDARSETMHELLTEAVVVVLGYRPAAVAHLGLTAEQLADRYPGLVIVQLSAWGAEHPDRRGFDSLVQAESGIAMIESADGERPGALPAQALDHSAGYFLAAATMVALARQREEGGSWHVSTSLRRIAAELLGMPRRSAPDAEAEFDLEPHTATFAVAGHSLVTARPVLPDAEFAAPRPWGSDQPRW